MGAAVRRPPSMRRPTGACKRAVRTPLRGAGLILLKAWPAHPVCNGVVPIWQIATEPHHVQAHPDCHRRVRAGRQGPGQGPGAGQGPQCRGRYRHCFRAVGRRHV
ncbi:hypothetical protein SMG44B_20048 [Stenotrophomonas maltophilia]